MGRVLSSICFRLMCLAQRAAGKPLLVVTAGILFPVIVYTILALIGIVGLAGLLLAAWCALVLGILFMGRLMNRESARIAAALAGEGDAFFIRHAEFRIFVAEIFRKRGYRVSPWHRAENRHGTRGLTLLREDRRIAACLDFWRDRRVAVGQVRVAYEEALREGHSHVYIVTTGLYAEDAAQYARERSDTLHLIDRVVLRELIEGTPLSDAATEKSPLLERLLDRRALVPRPPPCPFCGGTMKLLRLPRRRAFWGCMLYPVCAGKRELSPFDKRVNEIIDGELGEEISETQQPGEEST